MPSSRSGGNNFCFGVAFPEGIFGLQRGDGMNFVGAANGGGRGFGESEIFYFAGFHEFGHGADGFFDGRFGIDAMLVVEVDVIDAEAF